MLNEYQNALRRLIELAQRKGRSGSLRMYQIQEDEIADPSLVSFRLYGSREYVTEVKIACGISYMHELLPLRAFYFPSLRDILQLRKTHEVRS
jgi:hypothetical protein